jgi:hypothetical protein
MLPRQPLPRQVTDGMAEKNYISDAKGALIALFLTLIISFIPIYTVL